jgi:hypothetical protein
MSVAAALVRRSGWNAVDEVLSARDSNSADILFKLSFHALGVNTRALLSIMAYMRPDNIPKKILTQPETPELCPQFSFCSNWERFVAQAVKDLVDLALIRADTQHETFSLHRLVQKQIKDHADQSQRHHAFHSAAAIISKALPRFDFFLESRLTWRRYAEHLPHVMYLRDCFCKERARNNGFQAQQIYCDLNNVCQRQVISLKLSMDSLD